VTISVARQVAVTRAAFVKVTLMLTVTLTEKTGLYQYRIQGLGGVSVHNFWWNFVFLFATYKHERALDSKK
jgi:hypothetical protein